MKHGILATALVVAINLIGYGAGFAFAAPAPGAQCARALSLARRTLLRKDVRLLGRCALSIADRRSAFPAERLCAPLRTPGKGIDRHERNARRRVLQACRRALPTWLPASCESAGPGNGTPLADASAVAECAVRTVRCSAARAVGFEYADLLGLLEGQHADNTAFAYGGSPGDTIASCFQQPQPVTTTTLLTPTTTVPTTSTTLGPPTTTTTLLSPVPPNVVVTELMSNPAALSDSQGEYFEVINASVAAIDLQGLEVSDLGSDSFTVDVSLPLAPGEHAVFAKGAAAADGKADFVYGSAMTLANSADAVLLSLNGIELDRIVYDGSFPLAAGASMQVDPGSLDAAANDDPANWCLSPTPMADGDLGSPGAANAPCSP